MRLSEETEAVCCNRFHVATSCVERRKALDDGLDGEEVALTTIRASSATKIAKSNVLIAASFMIHLTWSRRSTDFSGLDQKCVTYEESVRGKSTRRALSVRFGESLVSSFFETITVQVARRPKSLLMRWHFLEETCRQCTVAR